MEMINFYLKTIPFKKIKSSTMFKRFIGESFG